MPTSRPNNLFVHFEPNSFDHLGNIFAISRRWLPLGHWRTACMNLQPVTTAAMVKPSRVSRLPRASWSHWLWCATEALVFQDETVPQPSNILVPDSISNGIVPLNIDFDYSKRSGTLKRCAIGSLMRDSISSFASTSTMLLYRRLSEPWSNVQQTDEIYKVHCLFLSSARTSQYITSSWKIAARCNSAPTPILILHRQIF